eukprot:CAMPEP_0119370326 /NCGR_PEP_ID=MMETSP1334-20130426/16711_1 /TAXON_ID=127549 /ORGANISM="Calcidiscus leptoporus, Strain RCC1130" /LENGTH=37 /DNA_ID= /DNA_START= /DNA_END= /DNA_ORIENTATION=
MTRSHTRRYTPTSMHAHAMFYEPSWDRCAVAWQGSAG